MATIPAGTPGFQAMLRTSDDAELLLRYESGESFFASLKGGIEPAISRSRTGVSHNMSFEVVQAVGAPTLDKVIITNKTNMPLQLIVKNNGPATTISLGYYYERWTHGACPWKAQPNGCQPYVQQNMQKT